MTQERNKLGLKPDLVFNPSLVASKTLLCDLFYFLRVAFKAPLKALPISLALPQTLA